MLQERLSATAGRTFSVLIEAGSATRPQISESLGITKQTVSGAISELEERGLVEAIAVHQGPTGRSAVRYGLHHAGGWVAGVDLGSSRLRVAAAGLDGTLLADRIVPNPVPTMSRDWPDQLEVAAVCLAEVARTISQAEGGLLGVALAVPRAVASQRDLVVADPSDGDEQVLAALAPVAPAAIWLENDVNCEAIAQLRRDAGATLRSVLHLHVGAGVGAALIVDGRVIRGARGRAGELRHLRSPLPDRGGSLEDALSAAGLLTAAGHSSSTPLPAALDDLFSAAALGEPAARSALEDEAAGIAAVLQDLTAVIDPEVTVLSGQLGGRRLLQDLVRAECHRLGSAVNLVEDPLGDAAAVVGALALAEQRVLEGLLGAA